MPSSESEDFDQLARDWVRRSTPQREAAAFRGKYGVTMEEWIDLEARKGGGFHEAVKEAQKKAREALKEQDAAMIEHGKNLNRSINLMHELREANKRREGKE